MIDDAVSYVTDSDDWLATLVIGGVLFLLSVLVIPAFVLQGYLVRVLRETASGSEELPSFTRWGELLLDGVKLTLLSLVYGVVVAVPLVAFVGLVSLAPENRVTGLFALLFIPVFGVLALALNYVLPVAYTNFASTGSLRAAFDFGVVRRVAFSSEYAIPWLLALVVGAVVGLLGALLSVVLVGIPLLFASNVLVNYLWARGYRDAMAAAERAPSA